jgi:hypothetical protein
MTHSDSFTNHAVCQGVGKVYFHSAPRISLLNMSLPPARRLWYLKQEGICHCLRRSPTLARCCLWPMSNTARLNYHTGNDNWPDVFLS